MSQSQENKSHRLPIWVLNPREEKEACQNLKKFAYDQCSTYVEAMVECSKRNGLKVFPRCIPERDRMRECILFYQKDSKYLDNERDKIVQEKIYKLEQQLKEDK